MSDPCDQTTIAHWMDLYYREHALAEEAKKIALKLSVEVSEQKARADAAEADAKHSRLVLATCSREEKSHRDALAAARRECEELRKRVGSIASRLESARREPDDDCCGSNMAALQRNIAAGLVAALAAPADGDSKPYPEPRCTCHARHDGKHAQSCELWNTTGDM